MFWQTPLVLRYKYIACLVVAILKCNGKFPAIEYHVVKAYGEWRYSSMHS
jgi:hypothetical protein